MSLVAKLAVPSLKRLLAIEDERTRQLHAIHRTVQAHLEGPYQAALVHLDKANSSAVSAERRAEHLRLAEERFIDALGNFQGVEPLQRSWSGVYLAAICMLEHRVGEACQWAIGAHADAVNATVAECARVNNRLQARVSRRAKLLPDTDREPVSAGLLIGGSAAGVVAAAAGFTIASPIAFPLAATAGAAAGSAYAYRAYVRHRFRSRLDALSAFVGQVADLARALGADDLGSYVLSISNNGLFAFTSGGAN